jgi:hypothetical protein
LDLPIALKVRFPSAIPRRRQLSQTKSPKFGHEVPEANLPRLVVANHSEEVHRVAWKAADSALAGNSCSRPSGSPRKFLRARRHCLACQSRMSCHHLSRPVAIAARMVVHQDEEVGREDDCALKHFARMRERFIYGALADRCHFNQLLFGIEQNDAKPLTI